jgi:hypothetical protein
MRHLTSFFGTAALTAALAFAAPLAGATRTWTGAAGNTLWGVPNNWQEGVAPVAGDDLVFPASANYQANNNNLLAGIAFNSIRISGGTYNITGNAITLGAGGLSSPSNSYQSFSLDVTLGADQTWNMSSDVPGGGSLLVKGATNLNGKALTCTYANNTTNVWQGAINGTGSFTINGPGGPALLAANSTTAPMMLNGFANVHVSWFGPIIESGSLATELIVEDGATVGPVTVTNGSFLPGPIAGGTVNSGPLALASGTEFIAVVGGTMAGQFSQVVVAGNVDLGGTYLNFFGDAAVPVGSVLTLVANDGSDPVVGTFSGLPEGASLVAYGTSQVFTISYAGGTGNDVVLTARGVAPSSAVALTSSLNPADAHANVTFTATVTSTSGTPIGDVFFYDGNSEFGSASVDGSGHGSVITGALTAGTHTITAEYFGSGSFFGSASTSSPVSEVINPAAVSIFIPSSAHAPGSGGAFYTTDLVVSNPGPDSLSFTMKFLGHDQDGTSGPEQTFSLAAGQTTTYADVLGSVFSVGPAGGYGAIQLSSLSDRLIALAQTSTPGFGGTFGQSVPAADAFLFIDHDDPASIVAVREDASFRTNLILCNVSASPIDVTASLMSASGTVLGSRTYSLPPLGMTQVTRVVRDLGVPADTTGARLDLSTTSDSGAFAAYASVIDNATNDPRTLLPLFPGEDTTDAGAVWYLPSSARLAGANGAFYTTDLTISNTDVVDTSFTLQFLGHGQDGSSGPKMTFNLAAGRSVTYADVLGSVFGLDASYGALSVTDPSTSYLAVLGQTSTPGFGGTFGQSVPAEATISSDETPSIVGVREDAAFRTNLILCNASGAADQIGVTLLASDGSTLATKSYSFLPHEMIQVTRVVRDMGVPSDVDVTGARLVLSPVGEDSAFAAYASVIDNVTNDPRTLLPK